MKSKVQFYTGAIVAIVGILLLIFSSRIQAADVVVTGGVLFIVAALLDIVVTLSDKDNTGKHKAGSFLFAFNWIVSIAAVILGLCMIFIKDAFVPFVPYVFGLLCLFGALMLFYVLAIGLRPVMLSGWLYVIPIIILALAVVIVLRDATSQHEQIMIYTGIDALLFAIGSFAIGFGLVKHHKAERVAAQKEAAQKEAAKPVGIDDKA